MKIYRRNSATSAIAIFLVVLLSFGILVLPNLSFYKAKAVTDTFDVSSVSCTPSVAGLTNVASIDVTFTKTTGIPAGQGDMALVPTIGDKILLNGKTIRQIIANNPGTLPGISGNRVQIHFDNEKMVIYFDKSINAEDFIAIDGFDVFEITKDFKAVKNSLGTGEQLPKDTKFRFSNPATSAVWNRLPDTTDIDIVGAGLTVMSGGYKAAIQVLFNSNPGNMAGIEKEYNIKKLVKINGKTIEEINSQEAVPVIEINSGEINALITFYFKSTVSAANYLKYNGSDTVEFAKGFETVGGGKLIRNVRLTYDAVSSGVPTSGGFKIEEFTNPTYDINVSSAAFTVLSGSYKGVLKILFDQNPGIMEDAENDNYVKNIKINGKTLLEINSQEAVPVIRAKYGDGGNYLNLYFGVNISADSYLNFDGEDSLEISSGLVTVGGGILDSDVKLIYDIAASGSPVAGNWKTESEINDSKSYNISIIGAGLTIMESSYYAVQILFDQNPGINLNAQEENNIKNLIKFNGKTIAQINSEEADSLAIIAIYDGTDTNHLLTLYFKQSISSANKFKFDGTDTIELASGFRTANGGTLSKKVVLLYNAASGGTPVNGSWSITIVEPTTGDSSASSTGNSNGASSNSTSNPSTADYFSVLIAIAAVFSILAVFILQKERHKA